MRRSISLSPIRTESGANLRTANWTRLKFKGPHQQHHNQNRNYNNYGNYNNYNRGFNNQRFHNRGRGYYRNQNFTTTRYIPRRRYNSNRRDESRSRSRSYSRSRSASHDRSHSRSKYSHSRSRSTSGDRLSNSQEHNHSQSPSPKPKEKKTKIAVKTEAASYFSAQPSKSEMEFPEKVATDLSRWGSPDGNAVTFQSSSNKKMQEALAKSADAEEVQEKMKKTALESVARHEKSLHKIKLAQSKKVDSDSEQSDQSPIQKKKKKTKKKKTKAVKVSKKKQKVQKVKVDVSDSASSESESSDDNSSDVESSSSSPPPKKSKPAGKRKKLYSHKDEGQNSKGVAPQHPSFFSYPQGATPQPVMMMAPNMASGDMKMLNAYGQPMNLIKIEMPGPDGKMMQFFQFPSMPQGNMQPVVMAQPVGAMQQPAPQPVPPPQAQSIPSVTQSQAQQPTANDKQLPSHMRVVPVQDDSKELYHSTSSSYESKDLVDKQKRRKEVIRTRLWPRPASSNWSANENEERLQENASGESQNLDSQSTVDWSIKNTDDKSNTQDGDDSYIPGISSPKFSHNKPDADELCGQKIPTLGGAHAADQFAVREEESENVVVEEEEVTVDVPSTHDVSSHSIQPAGTAQAISQTGLIAYPQLVPGFQPVFSSPTIPGMLQIDNQASVKIEKNRWESAADEFVHRDKSQQSSDGECSSSSEEPEQAIKTRRGSDGKKSLKGKNLSAKTKNEEEKKGKKKKKTKKERKLSVVSEDTTSPVMKEKKRKKKKKNKDKDVDDQSDFEIKQKKSEKNIPQSSDVKKRKDDDLERNIPQELPLSHIRGLVPRKQDEGLRSIFVHIDFGKSRKSGKSLREAHDTYEDQFVSLFHEETTSAAETPLNMSRSTLKKIKIKPQGTRSVTHMTKLTLCERISQCNTEKEKQSNDKNSSQKVSVNLASLSSVENKFDKPKFRSPTKSPSPSSKSPSRSRSKSRSSKSRSKSRSERRYRSRSDSRSSYSSRSRSRSKSLPKAYTVDEERSRDDDKRVYRRDGNNRNYYHQNQQQFRYNQQQRYQNRGRGNYNNNFYNNNRGNRGNYYYNNRGNYNNRGYFNRNRGYYNNNNNRDRQQWRPNYNRDRRDSDRGGDRSFERRSYTRSPERDRGSSYSSGKSERSVERESYKSNAKESQVDARVIINKQAKQKSPHQWSHDKFEDAEVTKED